MKVFDQVPPNPESVNFVDENNRLVGFDMDRCCCETPGWFISSEVYMGYINDAVHKNQSSSGSIKDFPGLVFAPNNPIINSKDEYGESGMVVFQLSNPSTGELAYLHLYNIHNGYYGHGWSWCFSGDARLVDQGII